MSHLHPWGTAADFPQREVHALELILVIKHPCQKGIPLDLRVSPVHIFAENRHVAACCPVMSLHLCMTMGSICQGDPTVIHLHLLAAAERYL